MSAPTPRRSFLSGALAAAASTLLPRVARAYGDDGAFEPKVLLAGGVTGPAWASAPKRWCAEVDRRTSAPARSTVRAVKASESALLDGPLAYFSGQSSLAPFTPAEIAGLRQFLALGGLLVIDDADPQAGVFGRDARREMARVLPDATPIAVPAEHVLYKSFYLLRERRPYGRKSGPESAQAVVRAGAIRVLYLAHDLGGALARNELGTWQATVEGGDAQRELAIRFAVNVALYALTTNYKDDAVHANFLLKRRASAP
jgi:hypothetical protein